ncbi:eukaryotic translation initiation factor 2D-like [Dorcoceras hygrometricum]|uniref:Eukaryotic translation initiation factor 2D-like n=1 Tax=Dorcoceras hygrometricum TaxID=472368 RepID=A0A2Z7AGW1_9LAMI|nr:eukaryotic translation initiation factor 2D-like [Dorcoceras hygrometricum]
MSPLLPPRKVPLEDLIYTSCTDPIPQPAAARTPRLHQPSAVTHLFYAYVRKATDTKFNVAVLGRDLLLYWLATGSDDITADVIIALAFQLVQARLAIITAAENVLLSYSQKKNQKENVTSKAQIFISPISSHVLSPSLAPDPIPQPAAARTPRLHQPSDVTHLFYAYVRKATDREFNVVVLGRDLLLYWV